MRWVPTLRTGAWRCTLSLLGLPKASNNLWFFLRQCSRPNLRQAPTSYVVSVACTTAIIPSAEGGEGILAEQGVLVAKGDDSNDIETV
jgi:hypothetical protein